MKSPEMVVKELLQAMGIEASIERSEAAGQAVLSIKAQGDARDLIGPRGDTIHAIDHLAKKITEKHAPVAAGGQSDPSAELGAGRGEMFLVDVDGFRTRAIKDIETKAKMMAERARSFQYDVELSPMSAYERLIVHTALQHEPHVKTESQGEGRNRRVVIKYSAD